MIKRFIYRLWRSILVTVFMLVAVGCAADLSHDPQAVDAITIDYITTDFKADVDIDGNEFPISCMVEGKGTTLFGYAIYTSRSADISLAELKYDSVPVL